MSPDGVNPISMYWTWPRPWGMATMFSDRSSTHFTGRPSFLATAMATLCSDAMPALAPKAPPTWGVTIRNVPWSTPKIRDANRSNWCGIWVATYTVNSYDPSPSEPGTTAMALPSIGTTATRWLMNRPRTTTSADANGSTSFFGTDDAARFDPNDSNCSGAPGANAASAST